MANTTKTDSAKLPPEASPADGRTARKLVPLEKRLGRLRKAEAKRRHQLEVIQARTERTRSKMAALLTSVDEWVKASPGTKQTPPAG